MHRTWSPGPQHRPFEDGEFGHTRFSDASYVPSTIELLEVQSKNTEDQAVERDGTLSASSRMMRKTSSKNEQMEPLVGGVVSNHFKRMQRTFTQTKRNQRLQGRRFGVAFSAISALIVLLINTSGVIWAAVKQSDGFATLYVGSCDTSAVISQGLHLLINVLSTLLLGGSNYCMQCLISPTRDEIDTAHAQQKSLGLGSPGMRNLIYISWKRTAVWLVLGISSLPLHLLYNSVIFQSLGGNIYSFAYVSPGFAKGQDVGSDYSILLPSSLQLYPPNSTAPQGVYMTCFYQSYGSTLYSEFDACMEPDQGFAAACIEMNGTVESRFPTVGMLAVNNSLQQMQSFFSSPTNDMNIHNYTAAECLGMYGATRIVSSVSNVLAIINTTPSVSISTPLNVNGSVYFSGINRTTGSDLSKIDYNFQGDMNPPDKWMYSWAYNSSSTAYTCPAWSGTALDQRTFADLASDPQSWNLFGAPVSYCLAQKTEEHCEVKMSLYLMLAVASCNLAKLICLILSFLAFQEEMLVTIGDAVASFLGRPDTSTRGDCLRSKGSSRAGPGLKEWTGKTSFWAQSAESFPAVDLCPSYHCRAICSRLSALQGHNRSNTVWWGPDIVKLRLWKDQRCASAEDTPGLLWLQSTADKRPAGQHPSAYRFLPVLSVQLHIYKHAPWRRMGSIRFQAPTTTSHCTCG